MINKKNLIYTIFCYGLTLLCVTGGVFADTTVNTTLGILAPTYEVIYQPTYITGNYTSGFVYVSITGNGIQPNSSGIWNNGTYNFSFYRGTGPFITGAGYSSSNLRSLITTTQTITRIDNIPPTFVGVAEGVSYSSAVTINFSDDLPGVTATINGSPFSNGSIISTNGTYQLIVTDAVGNTTGATFIVYLSSTPPGGGGDGGLPSLGTRVLTQPFCENRSCYSYYYDDVCGPCTPPEEPILPHTRPAFHYATPDAPIIAGSSYPRERIDAYQRGYKLGITTVSNIKDADLEGVLYRKFAAKMASEFAIKVIGLTPDDSRTCEFNDIKNEIPELQYYMRLSCKLGIMGLDYYGEPDTIFNPNYVITRDQFVTILSRLLFRTEYNIKYDEITLYDKAKNFVSHSLSNISKALGINLNINTPLDWYTKHLEIIKKLGIMTDYTISLKEFRIYVLLIMYRLDQLGINNIQKLSQ